MLCFAWSLNMQTETSPAIGADPLASTPSNVDQAELDKFSALASKWWDPNIEFKPLHAINPLRLDWIKVIVGDL